VTGFDYVIVGAGSAGCVLAARLSEDPGTRVLLLEAGGEDKRREIRIPAAFSKLYRSEVDWCYSTAPQEALDGREICFPRGRTLGGCSSINAQIVTCGHRNDYDGWAAGGAEGWGWDDVRPYFDRSAHGGFDATGLRDPSPLTRAFLAAAQEAGIEPAADHNAGEPEGAALVQVSQRRGRRWSVADGYLRPALGRPNLDVRTDAQATRVVVAGGRAVGVAWGDDEVRAEREVILAAGAINSPHLLLVSGIGPRGELERAGVELVHELRGVGRNLQDHVVGGILLTTTSKDTLYTAESLRSIARYLLFARGMLTSNVAEAIAFVRTRAELAAPDLELLFAPVLFVDEGLAPPPEHGATIGSIVLQPQTRGHVGLRSGDPLDAPVIEPRYLTDPAGDDLRVLLHGVRLARRIAAAPALARHVRAEFLPGADVQTDDELVAGVRERAHTLYHPVGTCRMGTDDDAVVDPELRVRGVAGLRVVDASVMPRIPRAHTNWPTVMIAEKAADLIRSAPAGPRAASAVTVASG
jgi:choline dehydrogenase